MKHDHCNHRRNEVCWIDRPEFSGSHSLLKQRSHAGEHRLEVLPGDSFELDAASAPGAHHFALHDRRILRVAGDVIEMRPDVSKQFFSGTQFLCKRMLDGIGEPAKNLVEHSAVKRLFVFEIVIKQSLIYSRRAGDGVGTGARNAFPGKLTHRRLKYGGAAFLRAAARSETGFDSSAFHLINQLVRL